MIKVYVDEGVGKVTLKTLLFELSRWGCQCLSAHDILNTPWEKDTRVLVIPGGRDIPYHESLKGEGNRRIRAFVERGRGFLGLCAGAYYGCRFVEFDKGMPLEVCGERELGFFPGKAVGPAYGPGTYHYNSEKGARMTDLSDSYFGDSFNIYFNGGCYFADTEAHPQVNTLSRYLDLPGQPAAIVECPVGEGKAILSGPHIEVGTTDPKTTLRGKMREDLKGHEPRRRQFLERVIESLT